MDPEIFEVHLFVPPWREFIDFLDIGERQDVKLHVVRIVEPATSFPRGGSPDLGNGPLPSFGTEFDSFANPQHRPWAASPAVGPAPRTRRAPLRDPPGEPSPARTALKPHNLDILHAINGGYPGATSALAAVLAGQTCARRRVMTVCSTAMPRSVLGPVERRVDRRVADSLDALVVPAERPAAALESRGFPRAIMEIIPWGARSIPYDVDPNARGRIGLPVQGPVIVCLANFTPTKGQAVIIDAMPALSARFPGIRAVLAGDGPELPALRKRAAARGVAENVQFPGPFEEPWDLLRSADVFVLASEIEGLPLVVLEAINQGVPVVATDVGGMPEAVIDDVTGYLIPPGNPAALTTAVTRILNDPAVVRRMREASLARFEQRFTMKRMLESHLIFT